MKLTVLGSSSAGNGYIIQDNEEALILEAGGKFDESQASPWLRCQQSVWSFDFSFTWRSLKYSRDFENCFPVFANRSVIEAKGLKKTIEIYPEKGFKTGNFKVFSFPCST